MTTPDPVPPLLDPVAEIVTTLGEALAAAAVTSVAVAELDTVIAWAATAGAVFAPSAITVATAAPAPPPTKAVSAKVAAATRHLGVRGAG
ncbi:MAG: hypothetical protein ACR2JG_13615 [Geodermatophilaceae bacterium]